MISYAYRFLYNFYGLISVSGFVDVKISSLGGCKDICNMLMLISHMPNIHILSIFCLSIRARDRNARRMTKFSGMCKKSLKFGELMLGTWVRKVEKKCGSKGWSADSLEKNFQPLFNFLRKWTVTKNLLALNKYKKFSLQIFLWKGFFYNNFFKHFLSNSQFYCAIDLRKLFIGDTFKNPHRALEFNEVLNFSVIAHSTDFSIQLSLPIKFYRNN